MKEKKVLLRIPYNLYEKIMSISKQQKMSINAFVLSAIVNALPENEKHLYSRPLRLIDKTKMACENGQLKHLFSLKDFKQWIFEYNIINDATGKPYSDNSINSLLSNSSLENKGKNKNLNEKILYRKKINNINHYWFDI
ncbi:hypothetical protein GMB86_06005 [Terrilactibacillus sp. BCM23-1]|uniref:Uncharacterized protein n=1 Tax=Terrilactibacillus tamarindi TaxID=2599694 RepID=A0A6N8CQV6_9BACI|nr:hypothetical protein [Terrilactibacillus tamarindi]MTT31567.1 hypothetical protein [Terrilactibacillus tamarindi]